MELRHIIAARLRLLHSRCCPWDCEDKCPDIFWLGQYGELVAASYLRTQGFKVLRRNFCLPGKGEIDLILQEGDTLVFSEVKTRRNEEFGTPLSAVDFTKRQAMRRVARYWHARLKRKDIPYRFDVVEVIVQPATPPIIRLHRNIFGPKEGRARRFSQDNL